MLDIGWAELFVMAVIALLVVGPKELPAMLRTIGKFIAMIKRQAQDFRNQFDDAIKDTEFEQVKNELQDLKSEATSTIRDVRDGIDEEMRELDDVRRDLDREHAKLDEEMKREYGDTTPADDGDDDWLEKHNRAVLEAEQSEASRVTESTASSTNSASVAAADPAVDSGSEDATAKPETGPELPERENRQPEKAGAAT